MPVCSKCKIEKDVTEFNKCSKNKSGLKCRCRECEKEDKKIYRENNKEKIKLSKKLYREKNREKIKEYTKNYKIDNKDKEIKKRVESKDKLVKLQKQYIEKTKNKVVIDKSLGMCCRGCKIVKPPTEFYLFERSRCKECEKKRMKEYREKYPEKRKQTKKKWNKNNPEAVKILRKRNKKRRLSRDPLYRVINRLRVRTSDFLKKKNISKDHSSIKIIGLHQVDFKNYIEQRFTEGMTWENYGYHGWHIDHIIPLSSAKNKEEAYKLCHYTNLQPLWCYDNWEKSDKIL